MIEKFSNWVIRWRIAILTVTVILVALAGMGGSRLRFSNDYRVYFSDQNPQLQAFEALQNMYTKTDNVMVAIAPKDGNVFTPKTLAAIEWFTKESWRLPYATRVSSVTNFQHTQAKGDDLIVRDLVSNAASLTPAQIGEIRKIALSEPLLVGQAVSRQGDVTAVNVTIGLPGKDLQEVPQVMAAAEKLIAKLRADYPELDIYVTGAVPIDNAFGSQSQKDLSTLTPIMYGVILLVAFLILRSVAGVVATVLIITFATVAAMGLSGWFGIQLTPPSAAAPTVILTLAVAHGIHVLLAIVHSMRQGMTKYEAIGASLKMNVYPITIATLTDVIGFATMNYSEVPPFRDLGNIITLGVIATYGLALVFLPALMAVLPIRIRTEKSQTHTVMENLAEFVIRWRTPILVASSLVVIGLCAAIPRNELNDNFVKYFDEDVQFRRDSDFINGKVAGLDAILYSVPAGESGGVSNPAYLAKLEEFANWYRQQPGVTYVVTVSDVMKRLNKNMHGDDPAWYKVPDSRALAAQYLLLYEMSLPFGLDLNNQINVDKSASLMTVIMKSAKSTEILALEDSAQAWLAKNAPPTMKTVGSGPSVMFAHIGQRNISSMLNGNIVSLILISGVLIAILRSVKIGLLSLVPNLAPAAVAFGIWGIFVGQVGLALSVVAVMTYGIVVDDTIHSMTKYVQARRKGMSSEDAVRLIFAEVGVASWAMSVILVSGFLVMSFSDFELNSSMGLMTALIIAIALLAEFFLLPPLLMLLDRRKYVQTSAAEDNNTTAAELKRA